jgi:acetyltransferase-like isoleucine patch superfamily enzyme
MIHFLLSPLYVFLGYCLTVIIFGIVHSQVVVRLMLPYRIAPGVYPLHSSARRLVAVRITADSIFKAMIKAFTFLPFIWGIFIFPYSMRLYGLKCAKNVHVVTRTQIETAGLVEIGENSFIGYNSVVKGHDIEMDGSITVAHTKIGKNCLVGTYSIVALGSTMEDRSVLGAKTVLREQTLPANQIWIGVPAQYLKDRKPRN